MNAKFAKSLFHIMNTYTFYALWLHFIFEFEFENDVKEYGIQTRTLPAAFTPMFENDVKEYGIQTAPLLTPPICLFENDVKEYGIQT